MRERRGAIGVTFTAVTLFTSANSVGVGQGHASAGHGGYRSAYKASDLTSWGDNPDDGGPSGFTEVTVGGIEAVQSGETISLDHNIGPHPTGGVMQQTNGWPPTRYTVLVTYQ